MTGGEIVHGPAPGQLFGRFRVLALLGRGAMGAVYRARDEQLGRLVALKVLLTLNDPQLRERFAREARAVATLRHPGIVALLDAGEERRVPWLAMELVEGETLARALERGHKGEGGAAPLEPREAARILAEVARALEHAHQAGIIHRDLKPANVLLERDGRARVADFGLARTLGDTGQRLSATGEIVGTPAYMSPEQASGEPASESSDVYGVGAVLYEALAGRPPHMGATPANVLFSVLQKEPPSPRSLNARVHRDLETICQKALAKEPRRRYESSAALAEDLERYLRGERIEARPVTALAGVMRGAAGRKVQVALLGMTLGALASLSVVLVKLSAFHSAENPASAHRQQEPERAASFAPFDTESDPDALVRRTTEALAKTRTPAELETLGKTARELEAYFRTRRLVANQRRRENLVFDPSLGERSAVASAIAGDAVPLMELVPAERARWRWAQASTWLWLREPTKATVLLEDSADETGESAYHLLARGELARERGQTENSLALLRRAATLAPDAADVQIACSNGLDGAGLFDEALALLRTLVSRDPRPGSLFAKRRLATLEVLLTGMEPFRAGDNSEALPFFLQAARQDPRHRYSARLAATSLIYLSRWSELEAFSKKALETQPEVSFLHVARATALMQLGRKEEALAEADAAVAVSPDEPATLHCRARALEALERYDEALRVMNRAIELEPKGAAGHEARAELLAQMGRLDEAVADADIALERTAPGDSLYGEISELRQHILAARERQGGH